MLFIYLFFIIFIFITFCFGHRVYDNFYISISGIFVFLTYIPYIPLYACY